MKRRHKVEARELGGGAGFGEQRKTNGVEFPRTPLAGQALKVIEGEGKAAAYLARLHAQQADPDELALIVGMLYGAALRGFCRVLAKALGAGHA